MVSPKISLPASRRSVPLISGLGIPPMTLDRVVICIVGVPISGIAIFRASTRQFVLWDRELVALPGLDHDFAAFVLADLAGNRAAEVAVAQPVENNLAETVES